MAISVNQTFNRVTRPSKVTPGSLSRAAVGYGFVIFFTIILGYPFYYLVTTAFKEPAEIFRYPPTFIPQSFTFENVLGAFTVLPFARLALNTFVISFGSVVGSLLSNSLAAYAIARLNFPGRKLLFAFSLITLVVPSWISLIPAYLFWRSMAPLHIGTGTIGPLVIPSFLGSAYAIFLMRQYFRTIPKELEEAARIDGATFARIYFSVFMPLSFPVLAVIGLGQFMASWNDLLNPLIYLTELEQQTVMVGLAYLQSAFNVVGYRGALYAASLFVALPPVIVYLLTNRVFIRGVVLGGLK
jgi:multiple sugar transport system permease protein